MKRISETFANTAIVANLFISNENIDKLWIANE